MAKKKVRQLALIKFTRNDFQVYIVSDTGIPPLKKYYDIFEWKMNILMRRHDTQHNNTKHNDIQYKGFVCDIQHK